MYGGNLVQFVDMILQVGEYCDKTDQQKIDKILNYLPMEIYVHVKGMTLLTHIVDAICKCAAHSAHTQTTTSTPNPWAQAPTKPAAPDKPTTSTSATAPGALLYNLYKFPVQTCTRECCLVNQLQWSSPKKHPKMMMLPWYLSVPLQQR